MTLFLITLLATTQHSPLASRTNASQIEARPEQDLEKRATAISMTLSLPLEDEEWLVTRPGSTVVYKSRDLRIAYSKESGEVISIVCLGLDQRMRNRPVQGNRFETDKEWHVHGERLIQKLWPKTKLTLIKVTRRGEHRVGAGEAWSSNSNIVVIDWKAFPVKGPQQLFSASFERGTGRFLSLRRGPLQTTKI